MNKCIELLEEGKLDGLKEEFAKLSVSEQKVILILFVDTFRLDTCSLDLKDLIVRLNG